MKIQSKHVFLISLVLICLGTLAGLYFLTDFLGKPSAPPSAELEAEQQRISQLQAQLEALEKSSTPPPKPGTPADAAYLLGLKQHEALLAEIRSELKFASDEANAAHLALAEAKETERRTREAATTFLGVFAIIAALIAGQGYLTLEGWKETAKTELGKALVAVEEGKKNLDAAQVELNKGLQQLDDVQPLLKSIREARESLDTNLPIFLERARDQVLLKEGQDPGAPIQQGDLVLIDEIDHSTYLANPRMRFQRDRTEKDAKQYLDSLLLVARGHFARSNYDETISRLDEFFKVLKQNSQLAIADEELGRAYSYRAFAHYHLLRKRRGAPTWMRQAKLDTANNLWTAALADAIKAEDGDPTHAYFVQALLYSREYVPDWLLADPAGKAMFLEGQRKAVAFYDKMLQQNLKFWPVPINLACCLKRIADTSGLPTDYADMKNRLANYPNDKDLDLSATAAGGSDTESRFLWQNMLADADLFGELKTIDKVDYTKFWTDLLDQKVTLRKWRDDLVEIRRINPGASRWAIQL